MICLFAHHVIENLAAVDQDMRVGHGSVVGYAVEGFPELSPHLRYIATGKNARQTWRGPNVFLISIGRFSVAATAVASSLTHACFPTVGVGKSPLITVLVQPRPQLLLLLVDVDVLSHTCNRGVNDKLRHSK